MPQNLVLLISLEYQIIDKVVCSNRIPVLSLGSGQKTSTVFYYRP